MKHELMYSPLTERVYIVDGNKQKKDVTAAFLQMVINWVSEGNRDEMESGEMPEASKGITVNDVPVFEITVRKVKQ